MGLFFWQKNRNVSAKKLKKMLQKNQLDQVVELLTTGNKATILRAIDALQDDNNIAVKRGLIALANHADAEIAAKARLTLDHMGLTTEERSLIDNTK